MKRLAITLSLLWSVQSTLITHAQETLPKGVRFFVYKHIKSSKVDSFYNDQMENKQLFYRANLDASTLSDIDALNEYYFKQLKEHHPQAYDEFTAGEWEIEAKAKGVAHGFGFGYGITDKLTAFLIIPYMDIEVDANVVRTKGNNYAATQAKVESSQKPRNGVYINSNDLLDANDNTLKRVLENYYGYKPIGKWQAKGIGDVELGGKYNFFSNDQFSFVSNLALILPTGKEDDPDNLQDVPFGTGHLGTYSGIELVYTYNSILSLNLSTQATYFFPDYKTLRAPEDDEYFLSERKEEFKVSPKIKWANIIKLNSSITDWLSLSAGLTYTYQGKTKYESRDERANTILSNSSETESRGYITSINFSSIQAFLNKEFIAPGNIIFSHEGSLGGKNVPDYKLYAIEFRSLF